MFTCFCALKKVVICCIKNPSFPLFSICLPEEATEPWKWIQKWFKSVWTLNIRINQIDYEHFEWFFLLLSEEVEYEYYRENAEDWTEKSKWNEAVMGSEGISIIRDHPILCVYVWIIYLDFSFKIEIISMCLVLHEYENISVALQQLICWRVCTHSIQCIKF